MAEGPRAFVTGWPVRHSRSPMIHRHWLSTLGLAGSYEAVEVSKQDFPRFLSSLKQNGWAGGNVTIPHKEAAFASVDRRDAAAEAIGAVNTLWFENDHLVGGNTDAAGFAANLDDQLPGWTDAERAIVYGAGGAARAVLHALISAGIERIDLVNRSLERAESLAARFGERVKPASWDEAQELTAAADLLVNTTSLGMKGQPDFPLTLENVRAGALASDIVYVPLETPFLARARARGLKTSDGLGMLLHQAAPGFERWFGIRPKVDAPLRALVIADIEKANDT